ncbi:helix-turn-helix domain-containing protein [Thiothrix eikelboomii]|nr:helix-turn-helix domain-containing protein [Thiothrix eikelboomii]
MPVVKRAYHYRCYPTAEQEQQLAQTFGCARFVYNWALALKKKPRDSRC